MFRVCFTYIFFSILISVSIPREVNWTWAYISEHTRRRHSTNRFSFWRLAVWWWRLMCELNFALLWIVCESFRIEKIKWNQHNSSEWTFRLRGTAGCRMPKGSCSGRIEVILIRIHSDKFTSRTWFLHQHIRWPATMSSATNETIQWSLISMRAWAVMTTEFMTFAIGRYIWHFFSFCLRQEEWTKANNRCFGFHLICTAKHWWQSVIAARCQSQRNGIKLSNSHVLRVRRRLKWNESRSEIEIDQDHVTVVACAVMMMMMIQVEWYRC